MESGNSTINKKHETRHIVAILDLIGASEIINGERSETVMSIISHIFEQAYNTWPYLESAPDELHGIKRVAFSDNIALALELPEDMSVDRVKSVTEYFIKYISVFQAAALGYKLLFRGGISIGQLYMDSDTNFIWGKALVEAHILEEKTAVYPRVVLSQQLEQLELPDTTRIVKDFDGVYFVDYLSIVKIKSPKWIDEAKKIIQNAYVKYAKQKHILQKYGWLQHYIEGNN